MLEEMPRICHRCDEPIPERAAESLCQECFVILGPRDDFTDTVCYYCGVTWHAPTLPMCQLCYVQEGLAAKVAHAH